MSTRIEPDPNGDRPTSGTLFVAATPIGNLEDVTRRLERILGEVDVVAAEDTRRARKLLSALNIPRPELICYNDINKTRQAPRLVAQLLAGRSVILVTDGGTPNLSDPGYHLLSLATAERIPVVPLPGPSALATAVSISHLPVDRFVFAGFLPRRSGRLRRRLKELDACGMTLVLYESPHRIHRTVEALLEVLGNRPVLMARELTKIHEELFRGNLLSLQERICPGKLKGEITLLVGAASVEVDDGSNSRPDPI